MPDEEITSTENPRLKEGKDRLKNIKESSYEKAYRKVAKEDLKYFTGKDQGWDEDGARDTLKAEGRPALTLNRIQPIIRLICGARPKTEARFFAVEDGDVITADVLNSCKDHIEDLDINRWPYLQNDWFLNMVVNLRSVVEIRPNYNRDIRGEVELLLHDGMEFWFDDNSKKKDRSDGEYMFREINIAPKKAKEMFPGFSKRINELVAHAESATDGEVTHDKGPEDDYSDPKANYYNTSTKKLRIVYYWYKDKKKQTKIVDLASVDEMGDPVVHESPKSVGEINKSLEKHGKDEEGNSIALQRYKVFSVEYTKVRYMIFSADLIFEEGITPWERSDGVKTFLSEQIPFLCAEPERINAGTARELISIINPLKDSQKFHNKLASAVIAIFGSTANAGWEYEKGTLGEEEKKKLRKYGSKPGIGIEWEEGALSRNRARRITPATPPHGLMSEAKNMADELIDISGTESLYNTRTLGKDASGIAIDLKQRQGGNIISWIYNSFRFFDHVLTECERDAIQVMYDYEKVIRIRGKKDEYIKINETMYDEQGGIVEILNNLTVGKYDVVISDKEVMPTQRMETAKFFSEMVKSGALQLPPEILAKIFVVLSDDPELKRIIEDEMGDWMERQQAVGPEAATAGAGA